MFYHYAADIFERLFFCCWLLRLFDYIQLIISFPFTVSDVKESVKPYIWNSLWEPSNCCKDAWLYINQLYDIYITSRQIKLNKVSDFPVDGLDWRNNIIFRIKLIDFLYLLEKEHQTEDQFYSQITLFQTDGLRQDEKELIIFPFHFNCIRDKNNQYFIVIIIRV